MVHINEIRQFITFSYFVEAQERRWCPFKQIRNERNRPYLFYDSSYAKDVEQAAITLRKSGTITCTNCVQEVFSEFDKTMSQSCIVMVFWNLI